MTVAPPGPSAPAVAVRRAVHATHAAFFAAGFAFASWAAEIPRFRDHLDLSPAELGFVLLAEAAGALLAMPSAGALIHRFGSRRIVDVPAVILAVGLTIVAFGYLSGVAPLVAGLFVFGVAYGTWDVAMNVQGAAVERRLGRSIMPRFHALFSVGTVAGALIGAAVVALDVPVTAHLAVVAVVLGIGVPISTRPFLPDTDEPEPGAPAGPRFSPLAAWREPRTLLIGVFVLAFAFTEGAGNDWVSVSLIDGYGLSPALATLGFATFLTAMTIGRWFGPALLDRYGRVAVVRGMAVLGVAGSVLFVFAPHPALAYAGTLLWGLGASLGFPVGMSAASDDPARAAARVSVVASIGYCAFLAGPPAVGFLGEHSTVLEALLSVTVLLGLAALISAVVATPGER